MIIAYRPIIAIVGGGFPFGPPPNGGVAPGPPRLPVPTTPKLPPPKPPRIPVPSGHIPPPLF